MKNFLSLLCSYLKRHIGTLLVLLISMGIFLLVFFLYELPLEAVGYAALLVCIFILLTAMVSFALFFAKHRTLEKLKSSMALSNFMLPASKDLIEKDYQDLIKSIDQDRTDLLNAKDRAFSDMVDYYTIWAHQIKTPLAAMRLLLQTQQSDINSELLEQLFKVEQYVEMVLQYLRLENMSNDLVIKRYSLDDIVKQAVRKYSKSFIRKKIRLNYGTLDRHVLTDKKWLVFVVEQLLSNALKYTHEGEISLYMDQSLPDTLVIEDTGIGIEQEDLPRVCERGYTGYNGRMDKKSTGIGLYLCKQILTKLSHTLTLESGAGRGTRVKIGLDAADRVSD